MRGAIGLLVGIACACTDRGGGPSVSFENFQLHQYEHTGRQPIPGCPWCQTGHAAAPMRGCGVAHPGWCPNDGLVPEPSEPSDPFTTVEAVTLDD